MTGGPEHYAQAERLVNGDSQDQMAALVHALLALAAATASYIPFDDASDDNPRATVIDPGWEGVLGAERLTRDGGYTR